MTKLEEIARAIWLAEAARAGIGRRSKWEDESADTRSRYYPLARAAVEAMRKPTLFVLEAGRNANRMISGNKLGLEYIAPDAAWEAMVNAILEGK